MAGPIGLPLSSTVLPLPVVPRIDEGSPFGCRCGWIQVMLMRSRPWPPAQLHYLVPGEGLSLDVFQLDGVEIRMLCRRLHPVSCSGLGRFVHVECMLP